MAPGVPQRPGMGSRTSSAPTGELYKLDAGRRPSSAAKIGHTLLEEDEGFSSTSHDTPKRSRSRRRGDEVSSFLRRDYDSIASVSRIDRQLTNGDLFARRNPPGPVYQK